MLKGAALGVDCIDYALFQRGLQRTEGQVVLLVTLELQLRRVVHGLHHLGIVVPVIRNVASFVYMRRPKEPGPAYVCMNVDWGE